MRVAVIFFLLLTHVVWADLSAFDEMELERKAKAIREELNISMPTKEDREIARIRKELNLDFDTSSKDALLGNHKVDSVQPLVGVKEEKSLTDRFASTIDSVKEKLSVDKKDLNYSFSDTVSSFYESVGLEEGSSYGLPSLWGFNEKKKKSSSIDIPILSSMHDTTTNIYKGMKHSGESAELMSGMMYKSSQAYNKMFDFFDDSPFNIFDKKKKEKDGGIFDIFD
jgi:hypothetical protein